jgi:hypothetical protein
MGIEPTYAAWEAAVLPLNYTRSGRDCTPEARLRKRCLLHFDGGAHAGVTQGLR